MSFKILYKHFLSSAIRNKKALIIILGYFILLGLFVSLTGRVEDLMKNKSSFFLKEIKENYGDLRILIPYAFSLLLLPVVALINTFNLLVNEINNGSLRYLVHRTKRWQIYISKLLTELTYNSAAIFLSISLIILFLSIKGDLPIGYFDYAIMPIIVLCFYAFSFISLFLMINTFAKNQFSSLFYCLIALFLSILFMKMKFLKYISIFYYVPDIGNDTLTKVILNITGMLGFIVLTTMIGLYLFERRSL